MYITRNKTKIIKMLLLIGTTLLCCGVVILILLGIEQFKLGTKLANINQVSNLSHTLVRQQANTFSLLLVKKAKTNELIDALDNFAKEKLIIDANLYAPNGVLLARSRNAKDLKELLDSEQTETTQQIVEPIFSQQILVGFLRVTFDTRYGQTMESRVEKQFRQLYGKIIILILTGILFTNSIHYYFRRKNNHIHTVPKPVISQTKTKTQRFHSRRRLLKRN